MTYQERLQRMCEEIKSQDNLATAHPIYMVQERHRVFGLNNEYHDGGSMWVDEDYDEVTDEEELKNLERWENEGEDELISDTKCEKVFYINKWLNTQPFFTRLEAQHYIEENSHNLHEPRIYVASGHRNKEWKVLRALLSGEISVSELPKCFFE